MREFAFTVKRGIIKKLAYVRETRESLLLSHSNIHITYTRSHALSIYEQDARVCTRSLCGNVRYIHKRAYVARVFS